MSFRLTLAVEGTFMEFAKSPESLAARKHLPDTEGQDAVVHQTGTTVAHSVPVRGAANKPTSADRKSDASLCSAEVCSGSALNPHHHAKSGQGSGDGVPGGGEAAVLSSLDPIQTNRNKQLGRGKHCGRYTVRGQAPGSPETRFHRVNCKSWNCSYCAIRRAKRYRHAIRATAEARHLQRFLTLTLDPKKIEGDPVRYLNAAFAKLRVYLQRECGVAPQYIRVLEFQKNGNPHFHILIDRYIDLEWIRRAWVAVGGGSQVDIRFVDVHRVSRYLSKYLTTDLLMSAPLRCRRVTSSRGIKLLEKTASETTWTLVKVTISRLLDVYGRAVSAVWLDDDQMLESFTAILND
jgi:hypothetical protein